MHTASFALFHTRSSWGRWPGPREKEEDPAQVEGLCRTECGKDAWPSKQTAGKALSAAPLTLLPPWRSRIPKGHIQRSGCCETILFSFPSGSPAHLMPLALCKLPWGWRGRRCHVAEGKLPAMRSNQCPLGCEDTGNGPIDSI